MERFNESSISVCGKCAATISIEDSIFDECSESHFCDDDCFEAWAGDHFESVLDFYKKLNVG